MIRTVRLALVAYCLALLSLDAIHAQGAGPLPKFTFKAVALEGRNLTFAPTGELERCAIIKMEGRVPNPLGKYYLYYSPHKHVGIGLAYSDRIEGPWTEYAGNPVIEDAAIPDVCWIEERGKLHLWAHRKNSQTEMWTSKDGLHFDYHRVSITAKDIGTRNATYTRTYEYPLERYGSKYIMLYSGFIEERGIRCVWLAHSKDGTNWTQVKKPLAEPVEGEGNDLYGPALLQWKGRNFVVYQDHTAKRGGNVKYVELDRHLNPVADQGARYTLVDPVADSPVGNRYRGGEFHREGDTIYMYCGGGENPRRIVYATAKVADVGAPKEPEAVAKLQTDGAQLKKKEKARSKKRIRPAQPSAGEKPEREPSASASLDQILQGMELQTICETAFDKPIRMIPESKLLEDNKVARELPKDIDWVLEGAAEVFAKEGRLHLRNQSDHCVLWNTRDFPESFVAEWDFQHHAPQGTAIIFFAAQANEGGSIFTPGLPKRGGRFGKYTRGEINCYHISYTATNENGVPRGETHLKKDGKDVVKAKLANGLAPIDGKIERPFRIRLAKLKDRIILEVDGQISFDAIDRGEDYYQQGQIGFRQMAHTIEASYGYFRVQIVKSKTGS